MGGSSQEVLGGRHRFHVCPLGPQLEVAGQLGSLHLLLTPRQLQQLQELLNAVSLTGKASGWSGVVTGKAGQPELKRPPP